MNTPSHDCRRSDAPLTADSGPVPPPRRTAIRRFAPLVVVVALIGLAYGFGLHRHVSFETLVRHRAVIDRLMSEHALAAIAAYIALYIAVIGLSLPGGAIMTMMGGFLFGPAVGSAAAIAGALAGATVIFLVARTAAGEFLARRAGPFAAKLAKGFRDDAFNYLLFLRLVPFPFWVINLAAALFGVRLSTFVIATGLGILPATVAFAVFGAGLGSVATAQEARFNACLAAGRPDCAVDFDVASVFTPTLLCALSALAVLALVPAIARRLFKRKLEANSGPKTL